MSSINKALWSCRKKAHVLRSWKGGRTFGHLRCSEGRKNN